MEYQLEVKAIIKEAKGRFKSTRDSLDPIYRSQCRYEQRLGKVRSELSSLFRDVGLFFEEFYEEYKQRLSETGFILDRGGGDTIVNDADKGLGLCNRNYPPTEGNTRIIWNLRSFFRKDREKPSYYDGYERTTDSKYHAFKRDPEGRHELTKNLNGVDKRLREVLGTFCSDRKFTFDILLEMDDQDRRDIQVIVPKLVQDLDILREQIYSHYCILIRTKEGEQLIPLSEFKAGKHYEKITRSLFSSVKEGLNGFRGFPKPKPRLLEESLEKSDEDSDNSTLLNVDGERMRMKRTQTLDGEECYIVTEE